ncbi:MAG: hypothetical protein HY815_10420 [Candidatus Riflebacteria bacterium]|nr:hypothetical protein [Candidatus Riflebacteria bacterium]
MANGRYRPGECLDCTPFSLGHRRYRCWNRKGHGETEVTKALAVSCNGFFFASFDHDTVLGTVELALRSGYTFVEGESPRLAPDVLIHGDGLKITPVDQARLIAGIVPGVHSPNVKGPPVPFTDPVALAEIRRGMEAAVTDGSGKICRIAGFPVAGKTGSWKGSRWFACYAPADNPRFVVVAYTKGGSIHGGVEVCRRFFLSYLHGQGITVASGRKSRRHRLR